MPSLNWRCPSTSALHGVCSASEPLHALPSANRTWPLRVRGCAANDLLGGWAPTCRRTVPVQWVPAVWPVDGAEYSAVC